MLVHRLDLILLGKTNKIRGGQYILDHLVIS